MQGIQFTNKRFLYKFRESLR